MKAYGKSIAAAVAAVLMALQPLLVPGHGAWTLVDTLTTAIAVLGAGVVYVVPNLEGTIGQYAKQIVGAMIAAAESALLLADGGITGPEVVTIALAVFTFLGVAAAPYTPTYGKHALRDSGPIAA